jgi:hypothetical protein
VHRLRCVAGLPNARHRRHRRRIPGGDPGSQRDEVSGECPSRLAEAEHRNREIVSGSSSHVERLYSTRCTDLEAGRRPVALD